MKHKYKLEYNNVQLRQIEEWDLEYLRRWRNNPNNCKYLRKIPYITSQMQNAWFHKYLDDDTEMIFAIDEIQDIHQVVGSLALYNFEETRAEVGKILVGESRAHGLNVCANALYAVMEIAQKNLGLKELYLHVFKENIPANLVYRKVGFVIQEEHTVDNGMIEYTMSIELEESHEDTQYE